MVFASIVERGRSDPDLIVPVEILKLNRAADIILLLSEGQKRPAELVDLLGLTHPANMYTALRRLTRYHVVRKFSLQGRRIRLVYYSLTPSGRELAEIVQALKAWSQNNRGA